MLPQATLPARWYTTSASLLLPLLVDALDKQPGIIQSSVIDQNKKDYKTKVTEPKNRTWVSFPPEEARRAHLAMSW